MGLPVRLVEIMESWLEKITGGIKNINSDHSAIHKGYGMVFTIFLASMTSGQTVEYSFKAPSTLYAHIKNMVLQTLGGSVKVELLGGVTVTVDTGTAVPITNVNDNSDITPESTIKASPTYSGGSVLRTIYALADSTNQMVGSADISDNDNQEFVSKSEDEYYVLKITNLESSAIGPVVLGGFFYEEPEGLDV